MGTWSCAIYGSDDIGETTDYIYSECGITRDDTLTKELLEPHVERLYQRVSSYALMVQVLKLGVDVPDKMIRNTISVAESEILEIKDTNRHIWKCPDERIFYLQDFINKLEEYYATPTELAPPGSYLKKDKGEPANQFPYG
jgi:hypothetical protein